MEVFTQLGQNQFSFRVEYDELREKIPKHLLSQELTSVAFGNPTAILAANIIILPVLRYSCSLWRPPLLKGVPHFLPAQAAPTSPSGMSGHENTAPAKVREEQGTSSRNQTTTLGLFFCPY